MSRFASRRYWRSLVSEQARRNYTSLVTDQAPGRTMSGGSR
jgi:hypothetical protein